MKNIALLLILTLTMSLPDWAQSTPAPTKTPKNAVDYITHPVASITALHPTAVTAFAGDTESVVLTFQQGFVPIGFEWADSLGTTYTYTTLDSAVFSPYPAFTEIPTAPFNAQKFAATYSVLTTFDTEAGILDTIPSIGVQLWQVEKIEYSTWTNQWKLAGVYNLHPFRSVARTNNEAAFVKSVQVVGYLHNATH